jgi:hypothetical protein
METKYIIIAYTISNIVAIGFLIVSLKWKQIGRALYAALFIWASYTNWTTVHNNPTSYLGNAKYAIDFYRNIINGVFSQYITPFVSFVAVCQLLIGLAMLSKGIVFKAGCLGGIIFLVAIAPLGVAAAFPATLTWAVGLIILYRHPFEKNILNNNWVV